MDKGYEEYYLYKFKKYLSGVARYLQNKRLKNYKYRYDELPPDEKGQAYDSSYKTRLW